jgi:GTP cyclohydrolase I
MEPNKLFISWEEFFDRLKVIDIPDQIVYGIPKGGMIAAGFLKHAIPTHDPKMATAFLDDLVDSGATRDQYVKSFPGIPFFSLIDKAVSNITEWIVFPWERDHPNGPESIQENIVRQLQYIGENPNREGLKATPDRIVRAWKELFVGYREKPEELFTTFESDGYNQIVLLKSVELFSMCEHHMLPFFGQAHVAYIPDKRVIGISKLARLVDLYARRLQIQERIGEQVTDALMHFLEPLGAACIIEATHLCIQMRGVGKQHSTMITSSIKGVFLTKPEARAELMGLIK